MSARMSRRVLLQAAGALTAGLKTARLPAAETRPDTGSDDPRCSLAAQRERGRRLLELAVQAGARRYDEQAGLIADRGPYVGDPRRSKYHGTWVAWQSPNYAAALLETGAGVARANHIISRICDHVENDAGEPSFGNIHGVSEWKAVRDNNAISFALYEVTPLYLKHRDQLTLEVQQKLRDFLELGAVGIVRRQPEWFYSNIFLLTIASTLMLARALDRKDLGWLAGRQWKRWLERTAENNLVEANSPAYYLHQIGPVLAIAEYAVDDQMRQQAQQAADFLFILLAANYHVPSRMLGGTTARAYMDNCLHSHGSFELLMHYYFGVPLSPERTDPSGSIEIFAGSTAIVNYPHVPARAAQRLVWGRRYPDTLITRYGSYFGKDEEPAVVTCTNYQTADFSAASQAGVWSHYIQEIPLLITHGGDAARRTIFLHGGPENCLIDNHFAQSGLRLLGITYWDQPGWEKLAEWWKSGPPFAAEHRLYLGRVKDIRAIRIEGRPASEPFVFRPESLLVVEKPEIRLALRSLVPPGLLQAKSTLSIDEDGELQLVITYASSATADAFLKTPPTMFGMLIEVERPEPGVAVEGIEARLRNAEIRSTADPAGTWILSTGSLSVEAPVMPEARRRYVEKMRPPITDALIEHPLVTFSSPAAARKWFGI
jgi:hypothetical protein